MSKACCRVKTFKKRLREHYTGMLQLRTSFKGQESGLRVKLQMVRLRCRMGGAWLEVMMVGAECASPFLILLFPPFGGHVGSGQQKEEQEEMGSS